jgi:hypothetical protein
MQPVRLLLAACVVLLAATPAWADATAFLGTSSAPEHRTVRGFALGGSLLVVGFEFEYADTIEDADDGAPSLRTGMGNVFVQTPVAVLGLQPYLTTGAGMYRERLGEAQETHIGFNNGGGVKISLVGPLRARVDYRVFSLRGSPIASTVHRIYVGANLRF